MHTDGGGWTLAVNIANDLGEADLYFYTVGAPSTTANYGVGMDQFNLKLESEYRLTCEEAVGDTRKLFLAGLDPLDPIFTASGTIDTSELVCAQSADFSSARTGTSCVNTYEDDTHTYYGSEDWGVAWSMFDAVSTGSGGASTLRHCGSIYTDGSFRPGRLWFR
jgi:hypothetical protein